MHICGIIAEYNPFHKGHAYHISEAKRITNADYIVVVMSGDFTQRGCPAIVDKYARTRMALAAGADLVIEMPVCYATASADYFARAGIALLTALGADSVCFGSESGDIRSLQDLSALLLKEPAQYKILLAERLKDGLSFPRARQLAVKEVLGEAEASLLETSNNILAIEYLKAIQLFQSPLTPYTIKRSGADYLSTKLNSNSMPSAMAIRTSLQEGKSLGELISHMPDTALKIMAEEFTKGFPVTLDDFSILLHYKLMLQGSKDYSAYLDIHEDLSNKIQTNLEHFCDISSFITEHLKSKDLTYTRISRSLLHILLDIKVEDFHAAADQKYVYYIRILGFKESSKALFSTLKKSSSLPLLSKLSTASAQLSDQGYAMLTKDILASHLYDSVAARKACRAVKNEYRQKLIIL